jgi:putative transposase
MHRSGLYYQAVGVDEMTQTLMNMIDKEYTKHPFYGSPRLTAYLNREGYQVNIKRVKRLMGKMGIVAIYPKPRLSQANTCHRVYPYLLRGIDIERPNLVWSTDITYIRLKAGFMYLVAVIDWYSRYVLSWELSNTLDACFCVEALKMSLRQGKPSIFNTDQGSQFTSHSFTDVLSKNGIQISMDGKGRALDNIFVERLWRSVKYEDIYIKQYETVDHLHAGLTLYFNFYNRERLHQSLGYKTPFEIHFSQN